MIDPPSPRVVERECMRSRWSTPSLVVLALSSTLAATQAQQITYDLVYTSSGSASASGQITLDWSQIAGGTQPNESGGPLSPGVVSLSLTISGASGGNGSFTASDFSSWYLTASGVLNPAADLRSQSLTDFNLFNSSPSAPNGSSPFVLSPSGGGFSDELNLVSFAPVPEPSAFAWTAAGGLLGFALVRRWRRG